MSKKSPERYIGLTNLQMKRIRAQIEPGSVSGIQYTREIVRIRDKRTCQDCKKKWVPGTKRFDVHHLNGLCGKRSTTYESVKDLTGLITLCHKCHYNRPEHTVKKKSLRTVNG